MAAPNYRYHECKVRLLGGGLSVLERIGRYPLADRAHSLSCQPVFIVSAGRSGTTLLRSLLAAGKQIAMPPESYEIPRSIAEFQLYQLRGWKYLVHRVLSLFEKNPNFGLWKTDLKPAYDAAERIPVRERSLARLLDELFKVYAGQHFPSALLWGDHSTNNAFWLPWIYRAFPNAKYLHLVRDARDSIASFVEMGRTVEQATWQWLVSVRAAMVLGGRLAQDQFLEVKYEGLVSQPEITLQKICTFVGVQYQPLMHDFWKARTTIEHRFQKHHRNLATPVSKRSVGRWADRLTPPQQEYVSARVGRVLQDYGYTE